MGIEKTYRVSPTNIVTYDYQDIANGLGMKNFEIYKTVDSVGTNYSLVDYGNLSALRTEPINFDVAGTAINNPADFTLSLDLDLDLNAFQTSRTVGGGKAYFMFTSSQSQTSAYSSEWKHIVRVRKWDGTTETEITSVETVTKTGYGTSADYFVEVEIPKTKFSRGDQLRITIQGLVKGASASNEVITLNCTTAKRFIATIPFKLDI